MKMKSKINIQKSIIVSVVEMNTYSSISGE